MIQKKMILMTTVVYILPCHATEKRQITPITNNQKNIDNNKRKNSERDVPNDNALPYNRRDCIPKLEIHPKKRIQKETRKQNNSENDIIQELCKNLERSDYSPSRLQAIIKESMSHKMIQQANENIDTFLPLFTNMCIKEKNSLSMSNEADWIDHKERIKNLFRHTIILQAQPTPTLVKNHFANSKKMKRRLVQWFDISAEHHSALEKLITVAKDKYDNDLDVILHLIDPVRHNTWYTEQAHAFVSELPDKMGQEAAKTAIKNESLAAIQNKDTNASKEKMKQCTDDTQKAEY